MDQDDSPCPKPALAGVRRLDSQSLILQSLGLVVGLILLIRL